MKNKSVSKCVGGLVLTAVIISLFKNEALRDTLFTISNAVWLGVLFLSLRRGYEKPAKSNADKSDNKDKCDPKPDDESKPDPKPQPRYAEDWYESFGQKYLTDLVTDLNTKGHRRLKIDGHGNVKISEDEKDKISSFPRKRSWYALAKLLRADGLNAAVNNDLFVITW